LSVGHFFRNQNKKRAGGCVIITSMHI
jgi:hypothetical protein